MNEPEVGPVNDPMGEKGEKKMVMELAPGTDYVYRDMFNIFAGPDDVVIEFGNVRRESGTAAVIADRIVLTPKNAAKLQKILQQTLGTMKRKVREQKSK